MEVRAPTTKERAVRRPDLKSQTDAPDAVLPPVWLTSTTMMTEKMATNIAQIWCVCVCVCIHMYIIYLYIFIYLYIYLWYIYVYMSHYDDNWEDGYKYRVWCVYVCVYMYIYILHIYMYIYVCMYTYHIYIYAMFITSWWWLRRWRQESRTSDLCVCVCVCFGVCACVCAYVHISVCMCVTYISQEESAEVALVGA